MVLLLALALSFTRPRERIQGTHLCDRNIPRHCGYIFLNRSRWNPIARGCLWLIEVLSWLYQSSLIEAGKLSREQSWICQHWIVMLTSQIWSSYSLVVVCLRNEQESSYPRLSPKRKKERRITTVPCRVPIRRNWRLLWSMITGRGSIYDVRGIRSRARQRRRPL